MDQIGLGYLVYFTFLVDLDALTALDALQWLRTCEEVSKRFGLSQTTVSRQSRKCLDLFGLDCQRIEGAVAGA